MIFLLNSARCLSKRASALDTSYPACKPPATVPAGSIPNGETRPELARSLSEMIFQDPPKSLEIHSSTMVVADTSSKSSATVTDDKKKGQSVEPMLTPQPTPVPLPHREYASCVEEIIVWDLHKFSACNHDAELCGSCLTAWIDQQLNACTRDSTEYPSLNCTTRLGHDDIKSRVSRAVFER
jgi:hypothetical protein